MLTVDDRIEVLDREAELQFPNYSKMWGCIRPGCRTPAMSMSLMLDHSYIWYVSRLFHTRLAAWLTLSAIQPRC